MSNEKAKDQWTDLFEQEVAKLKEVIEAIKKDEDITLKEGLGYVHDIVDAAIKITESTSKIVPNWNEDKKKWAVNLIDEAVDLGEFHPVLGMIDDTNVDRILIGYLIDQAVKTLNNSVGDNWEKIDSYLKYAKMVEDILGMLSNG